MSHVTTAPVEKELDIAKLIKAFFRKIWLIMICAIIGGGLMAGYYTFSKPDTYTAAATMYVFTSNPNQTNYQYADQMTLNTATRLMETYMVVIRSQKVMSAVAARLNNAYEPEFLAQTIQVGSVSGTEVMRVAVTTGDPQLSMDICNAIAEFAPAEIIRVVNAGQVEVIDYAKLPEIPDNKNILVKALMGACIGAGLACVAITILFIRDRHVHADTDLTRWFNLPVLASIPRPGRLRPRKAKARLRYNLKAIENPSAKRARDMEGGPPLQKRQKRMIITEDTQPDIVEFYKLFRTGLNALMSRMNNNALAIISAIPSEGKSTLAANLSIVAAHEKRRVLLIDADMRKPVQHELFGLRRRRGGLIDILTGKAAFDEVVRRDVRPDLDLLPVGNIPPNPVELLNSLLMRDLLCELRMKYDWVILDTPPMNVVADALVLADQVAGAVLTVRRDVSNLDEIGLALETAEQMNMHLFGLVMTDASSKQVRKIQRRRSYYSTYGIGYEMQVPKPKPGTIRAFVQERVEIDTLGLESVQSSVHETISQK